MRQPALNWVLDRIIIAEKPNQQREASNTYVFRVNPRADRETIRRAVETIYEVKVFGVQTLNQAGKAKQGPARRNRRRAQGRTAAWKKAYVRLAAGEVIDIPEQA